jgi:hypothetical protein
VLEARSKMTPHRGDNEIVTQLRIMNQRMDQMANEFGGRLDRMERQHVKRVVR